MAVVVTYRKPNVVGKYRERVIRVDYGAADTTLTVDTKLNKVFAYACSPTSVTAVPIDYGTVSGGVITLEANAPGAACYIYVTAIGN